MSSSFNQPQPHEREATEKIGKTETFEGNITRPAPLKLQPTQTKSSGPSESTSPFPNFKFWRQEAAPPVQPIGENIELCGGQQEL